MKSALLFLLIYAQTALSLDTVTNKQDESETALMRPGYILPKAETHLFIDAMKKGEVVFSITTEAGLKVSDEFKDFIVVCFQAGRYQDAYYFVPESMKKDAEKALSIYGKTKPGFYAYLVIVSDQAKFKELALKSSAGAAGKNGAWYNYVAWNNDLSAFSATNGYVTIDRNKIESAVSVPNQNSNARHKDWSCGPNSGLRAMACLDEAKYIYDEFIDCCPRTINKDCIGDGGNVAMGVGGGLLFAGVIFAPITGGASLIPGLIMEGSGVAANLIGNAIPSDVGPKPHELAEYLSRTMKNHQAYYAGYSSTDDPQYGPQGHYERDFINDIRNYKPIIVLIISGTFQMHYVTVIGVKPSPFGGLSEAVILDTDGATGSISDDNLRYWLDRDGIANWIIDAKYNTIRFRNK